MFGPIHMPIHYQSSKYPKTSCPCGTEDLKPEKEHYLPGQSIHLMHFKTQGLPTNTCIHGTEETVANKTQGYRQDTTQQDFIVMVIGAVCKDKLLGAIKLKSKIKKLQQFPLIGETAAKQQAKESKIKKWDVEKNGLYTLAADHAAGHPQAARRAWWLACTRLPPASGGVHPPMAGLSIPTKWGNSPIGNPQKAISPNPKGGGTAAQIWMHESIQ
ncbi:hypothetical protein DSO57_1019845 [Entomophthora muscae]|uniref:Uncharacterized protein n=1 Tax=Entomophthora muscae TaxID=34485 RepID=A0ACC2TQU7_9FUNG|nr:hypothetical protein DSO57_1019845 [Entomophthora muscae]